MAVPLSQLPPNLDEVDVIIAGGGTAGCVVASRLSDADPNLSILVIEGGPNNYQNPTIVHPLLFMANVLPGSKNALFYQGPGRSNTHGYSGPIEVSASTYNVERSRSDFLQAAAQKGFPEVTDLMNFGTSDAMYRNLRFISQDGVRQDSAHRYLHPRLRDGEHPNLHVLVEHQVVRVLFDENKKANGVEFHQNPASIADGDAPPVTKTVKARRLVIVSSGALGSPLILERSGVGGRDALSRAGIEPVVDLPGVGSNYMDHHLLVYAYRSSLNPDETADALIGGRKDVAEALASNDKILGWNVADTTGKIRPTESEAAALGPKFQATWDKDFRDSPNRPMIILTSLNCYPADPAGIDPIQYMSCSTFTLYPYSRGHIHITGPGSPTLTTSLPASSAIVTE
ncbi:unnamed protein product [Parascedosporium putredinis]|uniref:Glucose-methanol-choline oxidoreductase N-terminal domain-containing protein n=1 Tax=Parascedosporium putredinis TaxID=1442378 RepID=A0A9P1MAM5_9PEZI|nr:unnamed protein product [Parascedosporium putredinis]CAI7996897.1 unnamed protein product [Parascedosporium putredinis]